MSRLQYVLVFPLGKGSGHELGLLTAWCFLM